MGRLFRLSRNVLGEFFRCFVKNLATTGVPHPQTSLRVPPGCALIRHSVMKKVDIRRNILYKCVSKFIVFLEKCYGVTKSN